MRYERTSENYRITTDQEAHQIDQIHEFLSHSYWSEGISYEQVEKKVRNAMSFSLLKESVQVGFARVITDGLAFAYLADVYIVPEERGKGLSKWLLQEILEHPEIKNVKKILLATNDAHGLYQKFGFKTFKNDDEIYMIRS